MWGRLIRKHASVRKIYLRHSKTPKLTGYLKKVVKLLSNFEII